MPGIKDRIFKNLKMFWDKYNTQITFLVSVFGLLVYLYKSWIAANFLTSSVYDESAYDARGFLVTSGRYEMYANYGPFFDHMPLSFIIPGIFQVLLQPARLDKRLRSCDGHSVTPLVCPPRARRLLHLVSRSGLHLLR